MLKRMSEDADANVDDPIRLRSYVNDFNALLFLFLPSPSPSCLYIKPKNRTLPHCVRMASVSGCVIDFHHR